LDPSLAALIDKQAIAEALVRYCHGVDRCDLGLLKSAFWPDGTADYGTSVLPSHGFCEGLVPLLLAMTSTMHNLSNILISLDGDRARAMSNCVAYHQTGGPEGPAELIAGGRYLDDLEKRGGEWRIFSRVYVLDWSRTGPSSHGHDGLFAQLTNRGARYPDDRWYKQARAQP
jgi:SnoaL-like domain